jgi:uncharacterized protein (TIGR03086 family)
MITVGGTMIDPTPRPATAVLDGVTALQRAYDGLAGVVSTLTTDRLALPTNCPGWDVRALLNHTLGTAVMFTRANAGELAGEDAGDVIGDDAVSAVARTAAANIDAWCAPGALDGTRVYPWGTFPAPVGLVINVSEVALHGWDVATAAGQAPELDADVAQVVFDLYRQIPLDEMRAHGVFGAEVSVPPSASVQDRLLGLLGREA